METMAYEFFSAWLNTKSEDMLAFVCPWLELGKQLLAYATKHSPVRVKIYLSLVGVCVCVDGPCE